MSLIIEEAIDMLAAPLEQSVDHLIDHSMLCYLENIKRAIEDEAFGRIRPVIKDVFPA